MEKLLARGRSILVTDKNVEALTRFVRHHDIIEKGQVVKDGSSEELRGKEEVQHRYLSV